LPVAVLPAFVFSVDAFSASFHGSISIHHSNTAKHGGRAST
jgi:hypothetical protein